ncbi:uncharacterized protein LOC110020512 [Phalaenopsis equestris]|uniref:uncharacterized protein LOC110020512 n=1 Tax=Phalaenopsis equestris TaxID=78828 RepID=UPI0009E5BB9D|nr:uncharacterized protein LOC110020512 [Phalaenopsis equestris]
MKHHSSSKPSNCSSMEMESSMLREEPHISSSHMRQLSSLRSHTNAPAIIVGDHGLSKTRKAKKQVRRRLNTSRLMNMAEARREIVTALKFHRAAMKRASEQQQKEKLMYQQSLLPLSQKPDASYSPPFSSSSSWTSPLFTPLPISDKLFSFPIPNQPLGLCLNLHSFKNVETTLSCNTKPPIVQQPTSSSSSSSTSSSSSSTADPMLHRVMGDEEMEEIRLISEKHDIEWNDIMNSVKTAWWSKFSNVLEANDGDDASKGDAFQMFCGVMEIPAWLSDGSEMNCRLSENQDSILPCLEIGEIEEQEEDWFGLLMIHKL